MEPIHVAILELDPKACQENHGARLTLLLRDLFSPRTITIQSFDHLPAELASPPTLILVRPACTESLADLVPCLRKRWHWAPIIGLFCTGKYTPAAVSRSLRTDLDDFFCCPFRDFDVFPRLQQLLQGNGEINTMPQTEEVQAWLRLEGIVGESKPFLQVVEHVLRVASSDATILLAGETGTGKELVARAIHYSSPRRSKPFVPVNCGALPDPLVENELFGHTKGAYTDASTAEKGLIAEAEEGTLFLDEVDTLSASAQVKLLRFLQDRVYRPMGSARSCTANVRIIAATNADLWQQVQAHRFREDLYYRLHVLAFRLPPLRERPEDIPRLVAHFLRRYSTQYGRGAFQPSADTLHKLAAYPWPGNVRELEAVIQRTVLLASTPGLRPQDIELPLPSQEDPATPRTSFREAKARVIEQFERTYLRTLLAAHQGNISQAAKHAGKERRAFTRLLEKYALHKPRRSGPAGWGTGHIALLAACILMEGALC
jgi:two-component system response regulator GlrR